MAVFLHICFRIVPQIARFQVFDAILFGLNLEIADERTEGRTDGRTHTLSYRAPRRHRQTSQSLSPIYIFSVLQNHDSVDKDQLDQAD